MKNLNLWDVTVKDLDINPKEELFISYGHDEANSEKLYVCSNNLVLTNFGENGIKRWSKDLSVDVTSDNRPVNITFLSLPNSVCVVFSNGELCSIDENSNSCDVVGVCDGGILAAEWSPDQELLVLVTRELKTILMSCMFDLIYESDLFGQDFGEKQFITVGWGKKETQFHGSEGKQAAKAKTEIVADPNLASDAVKITWRGDSCLYAIGFTFDGIRRFKVFDKEGLLQYTSEKQTGLESNLSWRPSGNIIATTQRLTDKYVVSFFEKNGLKHGGFDIPVNTTTFIEDILWSSDSEILTLQCIDKESNSQKLLLFTMSNYHWYLKQTLEFNCNLRINRILWDNDFEVANNKTLHIVLCNGQYFTYSWIWNIDHSRGKDDNDDAVIAVIDGTKLLVTGFRQTVVPPPMAALEIEFDAFINSVHFASHFTKDFVDTNSFFVITTDQKLTFYEQTNKFPLRYKAARTVNLDVYKFPLQHYNWFWLNNNTIVNISAEKDNSYNINEFNINVDKIEIRHTEAIPEAALRIEAHPSDTSILFLQLRNADILQYSVGGYFKPQDVTFESPCPSFNSIYIDNELHFVGLSHKGSLYLNKCMIMNNVSSFFVHSHFLLITTLQHELLCNELTKLGLNAIKDHSKIESAHIHKRKVERGAKLVIAVPNATRTVFQMPRGNLEAIQPRPLSLKIIGTYLDSSKYNEAFDLMRKERINLNLIHDHDPDKFMNSINIFLESITNNSWLNLFLSDLENVDVTRTMYSSSYAERNDLVVPENHYNNKIQRVCEDIRAHLSKYSIANSRILPLLTSYVKANNISDLENALSVIKGLKDKEGEGIKLPVSSDEALKYLLYMVDVGRLFDVALGMYDFDLVLLVATKSQKDPKEYIPMLNEFNEMEDNYKRFSINKHLKRFDEAVKYLVKCGTDKHNELQTFVKYHSLYTEALALFSPEENIYKQISDDYGSYLRLKKQFVEAGIIYERGSNYYKAIECYKDALEWELAINLAQLWSKETFQELCWDLASALKEAKRHVEVLTVLEHFYDDKEEAIQYAISNGQYKTALRLCTQYKKPEFRDERLLPVVIEEHKSLQELVESNWNIFLRHRNRLRMVRETKKQKHNDTYDPVYENKDSDLYSDAGSTLASSSRGSSRTHRSSKNRRKHERKVASLKEGSQYEDVALVMALHTLVTSSFEIRPQVREVNIALSCFGRNKEASVLQMSLEKLLKEMKDSFKEIWSNELVIEATNACIIAETAPEGNSVIPQGIGSLEPHIRIAPVIQDISWKLGGQ